MEISNSLCRLGVVGLLAVTLVIGLSTAAAQQGAGQQERWELRVFDQFLDQHPNIAQDLNKNPSLVNDQNYLSKHPELSQLLNQHPSLKERLQDNPAAFMQKEGGAEKQHH